MMRIAALYDIHGNLPALEAVLHEVHQSAIDQVVIGGDVVSGPMPGEVLTRLQQLDIPTHFIRGNADREVASLLSGADANTLPEAIRETTVWVAQQLPPDFPQMVAQWWETLTLPVEGIGRLLFCHATPYSDTELFTRLTPEDRLLPVFQTANANLVVCGHTHMRFDRQFGTVRVVNAGSIGMPYGKPGAHWLVLDADGVTFRHTTYDLAQAAQVIRETGYPEAEDFATNNVLLPATENEALEVFTKMEPGAYFAGIE